MKWDFEEALAYYRKQGAPGDQSAIIGLLREIQQQYGMIPAGILPDIAQSYSIKESFLTAIITRIPSLHLEGMHCLKICSGSNCCRKHDLTAFVQKTYGQNPKQFILKFCSCMHLCREGPNISWDGKQYSHADEELIKALIENSDPAASGKK